MLPIWAEVLSEREDETVSWKPPNWTWILTLVLRCPLRLSFSSCEMKIRHTVPPPCWRAMGHTGGGCVGSPRYSRCGLVLVAFIEASRSSQCVPAEAASSGQMNPRSEVWGEVPNATPVGHLNPTSHPVPSLPHCVLVPIHPDAGVRKHGSRRRDSGVSHSALPLLCPLCRHRLTGAVLSVLV